MASTRGRGVFIQYGEAPPERDILFRFQVRDCIQKEGGEICHIGL